MNASAKTPPTPFSGHADDALSQAVLTMRPGWIALRGCALDTGDADRQANMRRFGAELLELLVAALEG